MALHWPEKHKTVDEYNKEIKEIKDIVKQLKKDRVKVYISWIRTKVLEKLIRVEFVDNFWAKNMFNTTDDIIDLLVKKYWKKLDTEHLEAYIPDKMKNPELEIKIIKKIDKI